MGGYVGTVEVFKDDNIWMVWGNPNPFAGMRYTVHAVNPYHAMYIYRHEDTDPADTLAHKRM